LRSHGAPVEEEQVTGSAWRLAPDLCLCRRREGGLTTGGGAEGAAAIGWRGQERLRGGEAASQARRSNVLTEREAREARMDRDFDRGGKSSTDGSRVGCAVGKG
jgi:hypothetical protein